MPDHLLEIETVLSLISSGNWYTAHLDTEIKIYGSDRLIVSSKEGDAQTRIDMAFIARSPHYVRSLLGKVKSLEERLTLVELETMKARLHVLKLTTLIDLVNDEFKKALETVDLLKEPE